MEKVLNLENSQENIKKSEVLDMLRMNGFEHAETRAMVMKWTEQQEVLVTKENTRRASILFTIERTDLYLAGGDKDGALECLEDARAQAHYENDGELYLQIMKKMDEVEEQG